VAGGCSRASASNPTGAHPSGGGGDDSHDAREASPAQRAAASMPPQLVCALHAQTAVPALEEDGVGTPLQTNEAISVFEFLVRCPATMAFIGQVYVVGEVVGKVWDWLCGFEKTRWEYLQG
jgi:hypothetical protein